MHPLFRGTLLLLNLNLCKLSKTKSYEYLWFVFNSQIRIKINIDPLRPVVGNDLSKWSIFQFILTKYLADGSPHV